MSLPFPKTDLIAIPSNADPTKYISAADWNAVCSAINNLQTVFNVKTYGAKGDGVTDDTAAVQAAVAAIEALDTSGVTFRGGELYFPPSSGAYMLSQTITLNRHIKIRGDIVHPYGNTAVLQWTQPVHGIVVNSQNKGDGSVIEGVTLVGNWNGVTTAWTDTQLDDSLTGTGSSFVQPTPCGIVVYAGNVRVRDCFISTWAFDGIHIESVDATKNANDWRADNIIFSSLGRHGIYTCGDNSNAGVATKCQGGACHGYTIYERSFLGNTYVACHSEGSIHSFFSVNGNINTSQFIGCYQEASDAPSKFSPLTVVLGGKYGPDGNGNQFDPAYGPPMALGDFGGIPGLSGAPVNSPLRPPIRSIVASASGSTQITNYDHTLLLDPNGFILTAVMPTVASMKDSIVVFKNVTTVGGTCYIETVDSSQFEGWNTTIFELHPGEVAAFQCDGTKYRVLLPTNARDAWYSASTSANWAGSSPATSVGSALDRIAAALTALGHAP